MSCTAAGGFHATQRHRTECKRGYIKHNSMRKDEQRQRPEQSSGRQSCSRASGYGRSRGMAPIEETYRLLTGPCCRAICCRCSLSVHLHCLRLSLLLPFSSPSSTGFGSTSVLRPSTLISLLYHHQEVLIRVYETLKALDGVLSSSIILSLD